MLSVKGICTKSVSAALVAGLLVSPVVAKSDLQRFGDYAQFGVPLTAGLIALAKGDTEGLVQLGEGAVYNAAATHALKFAFDAERPDGGRHSFPSGHTSAATQGAAFLQFRYGWEYGLPAYAVAGVVGYSRVDARRHYWRDVIAGMALATGVQYAVTRMGYSVTNWMVTPVISEEQTGLAFNYTF